MLPPRQPRFRHPLFTIQRLARKLRKDCKKSFNPTQVRPTLYKNPSDKPVLSYYPPIWAQSRQEVCESLEWFRSFQGGVYFSNNIAKGYLLSAFPSQRDAFYHNGKLIISHGGGKAESLSYTREGQPKLCAAEDQNAQDNSVRALLTNYNRQIPLVLLIDDRYPRFPFDLSKKGIAYTVLGLYIITHVWQEYEEKTSTQRGRVVRFKFAFQWCDDQGIPWWWKKPENKAPNSEAHGSHKPCPPFRRSMPVKKKETKLSEIHPPDRLADSSSCLACSKSSPQVFSVGWACLHSSCPQFWILPTGAELPSSLEYHEPFLKLRSTISLDDELKDIRPLLPLTNPSNKVTTVHTFSKGWHCNICGRLSCRFKFEHWECAHCGNSLPVHGRTRTALELRVIDTSISFSGYKLKDSKIKQTHDQPFVNDRDGGHCMTFILPENKGYIHRIRPKNIKLREADEIFELYQEEASNGELPFRRFPLTTHKLRGALLTNYFSHNCGEPYKYVGGTNNTVPWEKAPEAVVRARDYITSRIKMALDLDSQFNEVLSAAYMERQKMSFHTDDERGLGPRVASLSLGSPASMHFRARQKHSERPVVLSVVLQHGDVLVMDGAGVQKYYEHTVVPVNFRIAATARWIAPSHT